MAQEIAPRSPHMTDEQYREILIEQYKRLIYRNKLYEKIVLKDKL
jgi:hypothetical protein